MDKRIKLGLIYTYDETWIGGTYYIENLVNSLNYLPDSKKPFITVFIHENSDRQQFLSRAYYPYLKFVYPFRPKYRVLASLHYRIKSILGWTFYRPKINDIDFIFPTQKNVLFEKIPNKIHWIADFQDLHLPHLFSNKEIENRNQSQLHVANNELPVIFSSESAKEDFHKFYPVRACREYVIPFAVHHQFRENSSNESVLAKYSIDKPYFIVCNQFWQHKNHKIIIDALKILNNNHDILVVCTGKPSDGRKKEYFDELISYAKESNVINSLLVLGFIPRNEQLELIEQSRCVIQPSFFEGWSTIVEDAKALNKQVILSDIAVHREQEPPHAIYFTPDNPSQLAKILSNHKITQSEYDYRRNQREFGEKFHEMLISELTIRSCL